jgi:nucleotide-binding universal stress UspA family protein
MSAGLVLRPIVAGVSGSAASLAALRWAGREAWLRGTPLRVVRAWENMAGRIAPYAVHARARVWEEDRAVARLRLEEAVRAALGPAPGVPVRVELADGRAARVLLDRAWGASLLVLGSGADQAEGAIGPVAQACLRGAACPVVMVSPDRAGVPVLA